MLMEKLIYIAGIIILLLIALKIFTLPIKLLFRLLINTVVGFICLFIVDLLGSFIGIVLGINVLNAVIIRTNIAPADKMDICHLK